MNGLVNQTDSGNFFCVPSCISGVHHFGLDFCVCDCFFNPTIEEVTFRLREWCMLGVFLFSAFTHLGHECQDLFESIQWNACVHRLYPCLYSHPKDFSGNGVRTHVNSKGKIPSTRGSEEGRTHDAASGKTVSLTHYQLSCSPPPPPQPPDLLPPPLPPPSPSNGNKEQRQAEKAHEKLDWREEPRITLPRF